MDDLLISAEDDETMLQLKKELEREFSQITFNDSVDFDYLGFRILRNDNNDVIVSSESYVVECLKEWVVKDTANTPANEDLMVINKDSSLLDEIKSKLFHSFVAKLLYVARYIRMDIYVAVSFLSTRVSKPTEEDWSKLNRIFMYLNYKKDLCVKYVGGHEIVPAVFCDASFGGETDYKSRTGIIAISAGSVISNVSRKQKMVTKSSAEAELVAMNDGCSVAVCFRNLLMELIDYDGEILLFEDNKSAMILADKGRSMNFRTKHINIQYYFIKQYVDWKMINIEYCPTDLMLADGMTKPLTGKRFVTFITELLWDREKNNL